MTRPASIDANRVETIVRNRIARKLNLAKKVYLAIAGAAAIAMPIALGILNAQSIRAQSAPTPTPKWEAVSIRPCDRPGPYVRSSPGRLSTGCRTVAEFIMGPFGLYANGRVHRGAGLKTIVGIEGGPGWATTAVYEINAKAETNADEGMMRGPMMLALLEDRFKLKYHTETREVPAYDLVVAKDDTKLRQHEAHGCTLRDVNSFPDPKETAAPDGKPICKGLGIGGVPEGHAYADGDNLDMLANGLYVMATDHPVANKTGLTGLYSFTLEYARPPWFNPDGSYTGVPGAAFDPSAEPANDPRPSINTALEETLGLRLVPSKELQLFIIIDSIERPSRN